MLASLSLTPGLTPIWAHVLIVLSVAANGIGHAFAADSKPTNDSQPPNKMNTSNGIKTIIGIVLLALAVTLYTGCTTAINGKYITSVSNKGFGVDVETANQGNGTPTVKLGFFSSRIMFTPTSTNGAVYAPRVMDAFSAKTSVSPFGSDISDNYGTGDVYIGGTNDTSKAIIPTGYSPQVTAAALGTSTNR